MFPPPSVLPLSAAARRAASRITVLAPGDGEAPRGPGGGDGEGRRGVRPAAAAMPALTVAERDEWLRTGSVVVRGLIDAAEAASCVGEMAELFPEGAANPKYGRGRGARAREGRGAPR